jgi:hypothetical protein
MGADVCALFGAGRGIEIGGESRACVRVFVTFAVGVGLARALRGGGGGYPWAFAAGCSAGVGRLPFRAMAGGVGVKSAAIVGIRSKIAARACGSGDFAKASGARGRAVDAAVAGVRRTGFSLARAAFAGFGEAADDGSCGGCGRCGRAGFAGAGVAGAVVSRRGRAGAVVSRRGRAGAVVSRRRLGARGRVADGGACGACGRCGAGLSACV